MTMEDLKALERAHENAVRDLQNLAVIIVESVLLGKNPSDAQILAYESKKKKVMDINADLAKALDTEFNDVIYGGAR